MKLLRNIFLFWAVGIILLSPGITLAVLVEGQVDNSMVPCGYDGAHGPVVDGKSRIGTLDGKLNPNEQCTFNDFVRLSGNIVNGTVIFISVYAAISFMYAGYAYLTSGGSQEKVNYAKGIFKKVLIGYLVILTAWLVISMLEEAFYATDTDKEGKPTRPDSFLQEGTPR